MREIVPGINTWSVFSEEKGYAFNGYAVATPQGTLAVDPPEPGKQGWAALDELAPWYGVLLTNRNHGRAADAFRQRYGTTVRAHHRDHDRLALALDETLHGGETIAGEIEVVHVPGKSPGEIALHLAGRRALIVGDVVIGVPAGELSTYPDAVVDDRDELYRSAAKLLDYDFDALLLCDGEPLLAGGKERLREFVERAPT
jgi:glyoxylase-like metal-dependent hydrolase (beta-lactamase superfamily II)